MYLSLSSAVKNLQYLCVCVFFFSLNFEIFSPFIENFSIAKISAIIYLLSSFLTPVWVLFSTKAITKVIKLAWGLYFSMVISSVLYLSQNITVWNSTIFLNIVLFWVLLNHSRRDDRVFKTGLLWLVLSSSLLGILAYWGIGVDFSSSGRMSIFGDNENGIGIRMALSSLFLIDFCLNNYKNHGTHKLWLLVLLIPQLFLLLMVASRTAFFILILGLILFFILLPTKRKVGKLVIFILGIISAVYMSSYIMQDSVLLDRLINAREGDTSGRVEIWSKYLDLIIQHPLLGTGFTGHYSAFDNVSDVVSPHNVLIEVLLYSGMIGLCLFLAFLYYVFHYAWLYYKMEKYISPLFCCLVAAALIVSGQALGAKLFWVISAFSISYVFPKPDVRKTLK